MVRIKSNVREEVLEKNRQTLLDAAAEEFALQGFVHANINTISTRAGFAKGTVYNYFPSKQALILALIDSVAAEHLEYMQSALAGVDDPAVALESILPGWVRVRGGTPAPVEGDVQCSEQPEPGGEGVLFPGLRADVSPPDRTHPCAGHSTRRLPPSRTATHRKSADDGLPGHGVPGRCSGQTLVGSRARGGVRLERPAPRKKNK